MDFKSRIKYDNEKNIKKSLLFILIYLVFLVVTTIVAVAARHHYLYYFNYAIKRHLMIYENFLTNHEWWTEIGEVYLPAVLSPPPKQQSDVEKSEKNENAVESTEGTETTENSSSDTKKNNETDAEPAILEENILLGIPRLRQLRVKKEECSVTGKFMKSFDNVCYPLYSIWDQRREGQHKSSEYKSSFELSTMPISGQMHTYWGGGFLVNLHRYLNESKAVIKSLEESKWLDRGTRLIVFEFTLYNNNTELFNNVKILGEVPVTGGVLMLLKVRALQKFALWTGSVWIIIAAVIFYIIAIYYTVELVRIILKQGCKKCMKSWQWLDLVILILIFISFCYNIFHPIYLHSYLKDAVENKSDYHSLDIICWFNIHYMNLMAILAFLVWIKMFQLFNFNKTLLHLRATFLMCYKDLLNFVLIFAILFSAYAVLGMLLFGNVHADFFIFPIAFWTVMRMVLGDFDYIALERANRIMGPLYFISFIMIVTFILINMFLAIIYDTYREMKKIEIPPENNQLPQFFKKYSTIVKSGVKRGLNKLNLCKKSKSAKTRESLREVGSDHEPPFPPTAKPGERTPVLKSEVIENYFEIIKNKRDAEQMDKLSQHIAVLEEILAKMSDDIKRLEAETPDPSTRPDRPRDGRAPQRVKVFVNRHK